MIELIIATLGTYGPSTLLAEYDGPLDILSKLRKRGLPDCAVCLAVWIAIPVSYFAGIGILGYLAVIGGVILLERAL